MSIQSASDAVAIGEQKVTIETVLADVEFAAKHGRRCWLFGWLPEEVAADLRERGFQLTSNERYVNVEW